MKKATFIGSSGEFAFISEALKREFIVNTPSLNYHKYDILLDVNHGRFLRVQVKATSSLAKDGCFSLSLDKSPKAPVYSDKNIDFIVFYIEVLRIFYIIPVKAIRGKKFLRFHPQKRRGVYEIYRDAWWLLF